MSSRITMILALLFLCGALLAGYWGLVLSRSADEPATAAVATVPARPRLRPSLT
ncbi:Flp pilus assembly protein CpaB, partial [Pseudomonas sp. MAFF212428]|nr:Flp pilus assembly protein CpaB [Pseudomonas brassicae]